MTRASTRPGVHVGGKVAQRLKLVGRLGLHRVGVHDGRAGVAEGGVHRVREGVDRRRLAFTRDHEASVRDAPRRSFATAAIQSRVGSPRGRATAGSETDAGHADGRRDLPRDRGDVARPHRQAVIRPGTGRGRHRPRAHTAGSCARRAPGGGVPRSRGRSGGSRGRSRGNRRRARGRRRRGRSGTARRRIRRMRALRPRGRCRGWRDPIDATWPTGSAPADRGSAPRAWAS